MFRKPLVIMTPKSLLRNKDAASPLAEFAKGAFQTVIGESRRSSTPKKVKRVIACSGKVYYDLVNDARASARPTTSRSCASSSSIRSRTRRSRPSSKKYPNATEVVWCQDEPQNQGAWFFVQHYIHENMRRRPEARLRRPRRRRPRRRSATAHLHQEQQKALVEQAFGKLKGFVLTK